MSTIDDRSFRQMIAELLRDLARKVSSREVDAVSFDALPVSQCPPGYAIHTITFKVRRT